MQEFNGLNSVAKVMFGVTDHVGIHPSVDLNRGPYNHLDATPNLHFTQNFLEVKIMLK